MALIYPEDVARKVISLYTDSFGATLSSVETERDATEEVVLSDFVTRTITTDFNFVNFKQWQFPAMTVSVGNTAEADADDQRPQQYESFYGINVQLAYFLKHPDRRTLALMIMRYQQATMDFLNQHPQLDLGPETNILPGVTFAPSDVVPDGNILVMGLLTSFVLRVMGYGF